MNIETEHSVTIRLEPRDTARVRAELLSLANSPGMWTGQPRVTEIANTLGYPYLSRIFRELA